MTSEYYIFVIQSQAKSDLAKRRIPEILRLKPLDDTMVRNGQQPICHPGGSGATDRIFNHQSKNHFFCLSKQSLITSLFTQRSNQESMPGVFRIVISSLMLCKKRVANTLLAQASCNTVFAFKLYLLIDLKA
jgi:hypothetical protein